VVCAFFDDETKLLDGIEISEIRDELAQFRAQQVCEDINEFEYSEYDLEIYRN